MRKILVLASFAIVALCVMVKAGVPITLVDKIEPTDDVYMDMACTAASQSVADGGMPCGAVVILNGAWKGSGRATATATAEQNAIAKSRLKSLRNAYVFTVNEPTAEAYNDICRFGAEGCYFVNPKEKVIEKGIYPASAYDEALVDTTLTRVPLLQMNYDDATNLLK